MYETPFLTSEHGFSCLPLFFHLDTTFPLVGDTFLILSFSKSIQFVLWRTPANYRSKSYYNKTIKIDIPCVS